MQTTAPKGAPERRQLSFDEAARRLVAGIVLRAIIDAQAGDGGAARFLDEWAQDLGAALDWPRDCPLELRDWRRCPPVARSELRALSGELSARSTTPGAARARRSRERRKRLTSG